MSANRHATLIRIVALLLTSTLAVHALAAEYRVTDLGTLGGPSSGALAINEAGVVVGESAVAGGDRTHAFVWDAQIADLGELPNFPQTVGFGINDAGAIVGSAYVLGGTENHAVRWAGGSPTEIGTFLARDINYAGMVVGSLVIDLGGMNYATRAALWTGSPAVALGTLGGETSEAFAISDTGWIVGSSTTATNAPPHAFVWIAGSMHDLGTLGGDYSVAYAVNDAGQVVGASRNAAGLMHAFRFQVGPSGNVLARTDLGELGGGYSAAYGINAGGQVVGTSDDRAFIWSEGTMTDLNTQIASNSGWVLHSATAINNAGRIVGKGRHDGQPRAFLLAPMPNGDFDGDGDVDTADFAVFAQCFGGALNPPAADCPPGADADLDGDGDVDTADFAAFAQNFTGSL